MSHTFFARASLQFGLAPITEEPDALDTPKSTGTFRWLGGSMSAGRTVPFISGVHAVEESDEEGEDEEEKPTATPALPDDVPPPRMANIHDALYPANTLNIPIPTVAENEGDEEVCPACDTLPLL